MPFRSHYAKKEAREHSIAQNALAAGDLKEWHKHEAKAHRAGKHARGTGLMHTEYLMLGKENMSPNMGTATGIPIGGPPPAPILVGAEQPPVYTTMTSTSIMSTAASPIEVMEGSPYQTMTSPMMPGGMDVYGGMGMGMQGPTVMPTNMIYEGGMATLEPTIIVEPGFVEGARTIVEYGEPLMMTSVTGMMPAVMSGVTVTSGYVETQYGAPQFVGESVVMM